MLVPYHLQPFVLRASPQPLTDVQSGPRTAAARDRSGMLGISPGEAQG